MLTQLHYTLTKVKKVKSYYMTPLRNKVKYLEEPLRSVMENHQPKQWCGGKRYLEREVRRREADGVEVYSVLQVVSAEHRDGLSQASLCTHINNSINAQCFFTQSWQCKCCMQSSCTHIPSKHVLQLGDGIGHRHWRGPWRKAKVRILCTDTKLDGRHRNDVVHVNIHSIDGSDGSLQTLHALRALAVLQRTLIANGARFVFFTLLRPRIWILKDRTVGR